MKFKYFLNELALNPKHEKKYKEIGKKAGYEKRYKELFGKDDRIYLPLSTTVRVDVDEKFKSKIISLAYNFGDHITIDIKKGKVYFIDRNNNKKVEINIEDVIKKGETVAERNLLLNMYKSSPLRKKKSFNKLKVVISRNPCDIAGMSTNRAWRSCMNLYTGEYTPYVEKDIKHGTLIAYLIDIVDNDIEYPLGRVLIKPFESKDKKIKYLKMSERVYGNFPKEAKEVVQEWLDKHQKDIEGVFFFPYEKLYKDTREPAYIVTGKQKDKKVKLKIGDKVMILYPPDGNEDLVGKVGTIKFINYDMNPLPINVDFGKGLTWWCEKDSLTKELK